MKIVIDIDDEYFEQIKSHTEGTTAESEAVNAIRNGTPYEEKPKGDWTINEEWSLLEKCKVTIYTCPFCGRVEYEPFDYCRCGADMRKEK